MTTIGNASIDFVTTGFISNDSGKITTDGSGNMTVTGDITIKGALHASIGGSLTPTAFKFPSSTYALLPKSPAAGDSFLVTDGRKPGEKTSAGTGVLCVYDGKNWVDVSSGTTVIV